MKAKIRIQINAQIGPVPDIEFTENLPDMFYPVIWMEAVSRYSRVDRVVFRRAW